MRRDIESTPATADERDNLLGLMREHMADRLERTLQLMGLTLDQFTELYRTRGEVRTIRHRGTVAGYYWIEKRGRDLHLHAIFVLPEHRGLGIGSAAMQDLERELACISHRLSAASPDTSAPAALCSFDLLNVSPRIRLRWPRSQALQPPPSPPLRHDSR
jgi:GNAT superfamily N-acetyltransferase